MKKIFRMALVFALAGATLMYTGCSKDYSEDINRLDKDVSALGSELGTKYQDLLNQLTSAKTSLEAAYKAADKELSTDFNAKIAEINAAIEKKADAAKIEAAMDQLKKDLMAEAEELVKAAAALKQEVKDLLDEFYSKISNELRSLVFVPDFYYAGIEATDYSYANFATYKMTAIENAQISTTNEKVTYNKGAKLGNTTQGTYKNKGEDVSFTYTKGSVGTLTYEMNPSSFCVDSAKWSLTGMDREYVQFKGEEPKVWAPMFYSVKEVDGNAEIGYVIENYELVKYGTATKKSEQAIVPVIQATATFADGKTISSDWNAVILFEDKLHELAFSKTSNWVTDYTHPECSLSVNSNKKDLYVNADAALTPNPSVKALYNGGPIDLSKDVVLHMHDGVTGKREEVTLDEFTKKYPGFKFNFELVSYTIGANKTAEDAYGTITNDGIFTPCYVDEKGNSVVIAKDAEAGISAVGRAPMVLVQVIEPEHNLTVNWGFFRIEIVEKDPVLSTKVIDVKDFGVLPYLCNTSLNFKWYEFSAKVLEALNMTYQQFRSVYKIETANGAKDLVQGNTFTPQIYVKNGDKFEIAYKLDKDGKVITPVEALNFGTVTYTVDATGEGVNDAFKWEFDKAAAENLKKYEAVYVIFQANAYEKIAFKLSYEIADPAQITYGEINPSYWFDDVENGVDNTVRANVKVPNKTTDDVTVFTKDLDDFFVGNKVKVALKDESKEVYAEAWKTIQTVYSYKFAASQPVINGVPFVASTNGTHLYVATYDSNKKEYTKNNNGNYIPDTTKPIASLTTDGTLTYQTNDTAKKFLNLWGISETEVEKMLYANVQIDFEAGDGEECAIAKGTDVFHVRFVRPLTISNGEGGYLEDGVPTGSEIALGYLFNAIDWNGLNEEPLFKWHPKTNDENWEGFVANTFKGIVWYQYYGISKIKVDCNNAYTNQTGDWAPLKGENGVNPSAKLILYGGSTPDDDNTASQVAYKENNHKVINALSHFKLHYENNMGVAKDFALRIPVEVTYNWGTIKVDVEIPVKGTQTK